MVAMGSSPHGTGASSAISLEIRAPGWALIFRPCLCVMAKRRRDICGLPESEPLWRAGRGFVFGDLPWTVEKLRVIGRTDNRIIGSVVAKVLSPGRGFR